MSRYRRPPPRYGEEASGWSPTAVSAAENYEERTGVATGTDAAALARPS